MARGLGGLGWSRALLALKTLSLCFPKSRAGDQAIARVLQQRPQDFSTGSVTGLGLGVAPVTQAGDLIGCPHLPVGP